MLPSNLQDATADNCSRADSLQHAVMSKQIVWASCATTVDIAFHMLEVLLNPKIVTAHDTSPVFFLLVKPADMDVQVVGDEQVLHVQCLKTMHTD